MDRKTKIWVKAMEIGSRVWGCHQIPERSFFIHHYQFPVCARCTGVILGELIKVCSIRKTLIPPKIAALLTIPLMVDGTVQLKTTYESNNTKRFVSGVLFGYGASELFVTGVKRVIASARRR